jgi:hypothetical protein
MTRDRHIGNGGEAARRRCWDRGSRAQPHQAHQAVVQPGPPLRAAEAVPAASEPRQEAAGLRPVDRRHPGRAAGRVSLGGRRAAGPHPAGPPAPGAAAGRVAFGRPRERRSRTLPKPAGPRQLAGGVRRRRLDALLSRRCPGRRAAPAGRRMRAAAGLLGAVLQAARGWPGGSELSREAVDREGLRLRRWREALDRAAFAP